jgi:hypothetical protein
VSVGSRHVESLDFSSHGVKEHPRLPNQGEGFLSSPDPPPQGGRRKTAGRKTAVDAALKIGTGIERGRSARCVRARSVFGRAARATCAKVRFVEAGQWRIARSSLQILSTSVDGKISAGFGWRGSGEAHEDATGVRMTYACARGVGSDKPELSRPSLEMDHPSGWGFFGIRASTP